MCLEVGKATSAGREREHVDERYIGRAQEFPNGYVQLAVSPGSYKVELRFGAIAHTHTVSVGAGATVVVSDRLS